MAKREVWDIAVTGCSADWYGKEASTFFAPLFSGQPSYRQSAATSASTTTRGPKRRSPRATSAKNSDEAGVLWHQADQQVMQNAPFFPITQPNWPNYHAT